MSRLLAVAAVVLVALGALVTLRSSFQGDPTADQTVVLDPPAPPVGPPPGIMNGEWEELPLSSSALEFATEAFWTGDRLVVIWPTNGGGDVAGAAYFPAGDRVEVLPPSGLVWRANAAVVWTGDELIVAGGTNGPGIDVAARSYDPASNKWRTLPAPPGFVSGDPESPLVGPAAWIGEEMVAWRSGLAVNPSTNRWRRIAPSPLATRSDEALVATSSGLFVWGGCDPRQEPQCDENATGEEFVDGAMYDFAEDAWTVLPPSPLPPGSNPTATWTGSEVVVVVHAPADPTAANVAAYDPVAQRWRLLPNSPHPGGRYATAAWSGRYVIIHGGLDVTRQPTGATTALEVATGRWFTLPDGPPRDRHTATWTGDGFVVAGGSPSSSAWVFRQAP